MVCDASLGDRKAAFANGNVSVIVNADTTDTLMFDLWVPDDFPTGVYIQVFFQDRVTWSWKSNAYGSTDLRSGDWTTLLVDVKGLSPGLDISQGIQCGIELLFAEGTVWTGSVFADNVTLLESEIRQKKCWLTFESGGSRC